MRLDDLITTYPTLYHMAEGGTWESIRQHGLLSTAALLDRCRIHGKERQRLERCHRPACTTIAGRDGETFVLRDQKPMSDRGLERALAGSGMTPADWYQLVNGRVYFWLSEQRLARLLGAREYRGRMRTVLVLDTAPLVRAYAEVIELSPINSGCTKPFPQRRSRETFRPIAAYPFDQWREKRGARDAVVELTIPYRVPDLAGFVRRAEHRIGDRVVDVLYEDAKRRREHGKEKLLEPQMQTDVCLGDEDLS